ncbi:MAG: winged helix-turn-helix domain-containing protein [Bryobacteraceae bacterium]|jgi:TolB-like protein/DNA-binding winged helix-turn-helix (wHTH) protein/Flp pilus assembly protein TadD
MTTLAAAYRFGPFEIRTPTRELYKYGTRLKLRPQPFLILQVLAQRAGEVVTRDELRQMLWRGETFVDFEQGLNTSINELRRALSDSASAPRYVETLPKLGYRLIAPVQEAPAPLRAASAEAQSPVTATVAAPEPSEQAPSEQAPPARGARSRLLWLLLAVSATIVAASAYLLWQRARVRFEPSGGAILLAVLPFENLTGDAAQDYLSDGLTEEMIAQLGRINPARVGVIARTSVMHYKHTQERVAKIGEELGVQYVLEGSLRRQQDRVRVSAQLIRVRGETHAWAREYDRQLGDLLALQAEIAREISDEIQLAFGAGRTQPPLKRPALSPQQSAAYDLYLQGLYFWNKRTANDFWRAIGYFQQAIAKDPSHAPSYAGLADCYALMGGYTSESRPDYMVKARAAALRALEIDPDLPEAHTVLAVIVQNYDRDWQTSENEYRRAIQLNPGYAMAHHWYAEHLGYLGRFDEAFRESERARQLDPLSLIIAADHGFLLLYSRQYDRALEKCRSVLDLDPHFGRAAGCVLRVYEAKGMLEEALTRFAPDRRIPSDEAWYWSELAYVYGRSGERSTAERALQSALRINRPGQTDPAGFVVAYIGLDRKDQAFLWLEKAYAQHSNAMTALKVDPIYDPLRGDPRFEQLLHRVGLSP